MTEPVLPDKDTHGIIANRFRIFIRPITGITKVEIKTTLGKFFTKSYEINFLSGVHAQLNSTIPPSAVGIHNEASAGQNRGEIHESFQQFAVCCPFCKPPNNLIHQIFRHCGDLFFGVAREGGVRLGFGFNSEEIEGGQVVLHSGIPSFFLFCPLRTIPF